MFWDLCEYKKSMYSQLDQLQIEIKEIMFLFSYAYMRSMHQIILI